MPRRRSTSSEAARKRRMAAARVRRADYLAEKGVLEHAITHYEKATELDGHNPDARVKLGDAYFEAEMPRKAYQAYRKALKIHPRHAEAHFCLGEF
ncbi:tetratricopeptide repeat protein, partial [bacterium]|nr:tetratricopeptide repeat protein [bacterium]